MENKYYVPSIEEFFEGFEVEVSDTYLDESISNETIWTKLKFTLDNHNVLDEHYTRVKVLDKSDIEDLGFTILEETKLIMRAKLQRNTTDFYSLTYYGEDSLYIDFHYPHILNAETLTIISKFGGTIKNKSELKLVLKMLNIL